MPDPLVTIAAVLRRRSPHARRSPLDTATRLADLGFDSVTLVEVLLEIEDATGASCDPALLTRSDLTIGDLLPR